MTRHSAPLAVLVLGGVLALAIGLGGGDEAAAPHSPAPHVAVAAPAAPVPSPLEAVVTPQGPMPAGAAPTLDDVVTFDAPTELLVTALDADDAIVVAEAVNALVGRSAVSALPALVAHDVLAHPTAAPSIIYGLGRLAAQAEPADRSAAVDRLLALMAEEKRRGAQESLGNLIQIYEALGDTGDARAIAPLERELLDASVATAPKVVIVQSLVELGARGSRTALGQLAAVLEHAPASAGFEAELQRELLAAIREALVQLT